MEFIKMIGAIMVFFVFLVGGLWLVADNVNSGNIEDSAALKNETSALTAVSGVLNMTYIGEREQYTDLVAGEIQEENALDFMIGNGFKAIQNVVQTLKVINNVIGMVAIRMGIPPFIINAAIVFLLAAMGITLIYMMFRFKPQ